MCGIIGYIGNKDVTIKSLLRNAVFNIYRGNDGIGVMYLDDKTWNICRYLYGVDEIFTKELRKDSIIKKVKVGSFDYSIKDKEEYKKKNDIFKNKMREFLDITSNMIFIHHRKGTYGSNTLANLHPIKCNGKYYMHNGTVSSIDAIRKYLEIFASIKFTSETDTEVLAILYNHLKDKLKDKDKVYNTFREMFPYGWGVLIELNPKTNEVVVIKDFDRKLWVYKSDGEMLFMSEPTPYVRGFTSLHLLKDGIFELPNEFTGFNYTEKAKKALKWWTVKPSDWKPDCKCDVCKTNKFALNTFSCAGYKLETEREDRCMECFLMELPKPLDEDDNLEMEGKKMCYLDYLGEKK